MRVIPRRPAVWSAALMLALLAPGAAYAFPFPAVTLEGGLSSTSLIPDPYQETHRILGGTGGVAFDIHINDRIAIEPELMFVRRGTRLGDAEAIDGGGAPLGSYSTYITADYTDVPVLARFEPTTESMFKTFAVVGPRFGFKTAERVETRGAVAGTYDSSRFESFEFGATAGGGVEYGEGPHRVVLDIRYDTGITKHDDGSGGSFRSDAFFLMVGYVFHPSE
jgi:hypothetical protein